MIFNKNKIQLCNVYIKLFTGKTNLRLGKFHKATKNNIILILAQIVLILLLNRVFIIIHD